MRLYTLSGKNEVANQAKISFLTGVIMRQNIVEKCAYRVLNQSYLCTVTPGQKRKVLEEGEGTFYFCALTR